MPSRLVVASLLGTLSVLLAQEPRPKVVCAPSVRAAVSGSDVKLQAWAESKHGLRYQWTSEAGAISPGESGKAVWSLKGVEEKAQPAWVEAFDGNTSIGTCAMEVQVVHSMLNPGARGENDLTKGKVFLYKGQTEPDNYGLYSYLLLGNVKDAKRNLAILKGLLDAVPGLLVEMTRLDSREVNAVNIPLTGEPQPGDAKPDADASALLRRYNYSAAAEWFRGVNKDRGSSLAASGLYLVASKRRIAERKPNEELLVVDLTRVPVDVAGEFAEKFVNQAAQYDFSRATLMQFGMKADLQLRLLAESFSKTISALGPFVKFLPAAK